MTLKALYAAATGMDAQEARIGSISNNLANINTTGFKSDHVAFEDLIYDQVQTPGSKNSSNTTAPIGIQVGHGTRLVGVYKHFTQGELMQTSRELDVAVEGNGFLQVTMDDGTPAYTRDGSIRLNADGQLVTSRGYAIEPAITIPADATSVTIGRDGVISATTPGATTASEAGQLQLVIFQNPSGLKAIGQNMYQETTASGTATSTTPGTSGAGTISQGFLENSNVNVAEELINMIIAQRSYEANSKVMQTSNEMMRTSTNVI
ncbi:MAG: hypothetical protein ACD_73C00298G0002 [uncultured bacterium]|nr:MAG: hypothetical protein ACD_73C00298G0002 [uncultured bacterium]